MAERKKIREYRDALHGMARPQKEGRRKSLEGKAAKLGTEIYGEERKAKPKTRGGAKPRQ
ncbi:MAG TPA: hypothetical protein VFG64_09360 [Dongiaceae bacterium]|nr:hypothetical protein [Dongiaceae bacterium]